MTMFEKLKFSNLAKTFDDLRKSTSEWVIALDTKQYDLQERVKELEFRLKQLEEFHNKGVR